ncbi:RpiB/LacA/LacB family sugar-phosphate isomerase, partial [Shigella sp. FC1967]|uniref:RpiB/LacA/LacB family sugar-phosphate isomerase n=1 Tax=Shigella sp. FC1967 TaxID=1898041 RepID=UPI000AC18464
SEHPEYIGFVFCGTGMGVSISANKHKNVYCGVCKVGSIISEHPEYIGFVFCGTGMGVSISANKHKNVYCGVC